MGEHALPIHFKEIQACGEVLKATNLFVTLATEKVKHFLPEKALKAGRDRISSEDGERERGREGEAGVKEV